MKNALLLPLRFLLGLLVCLAVAALLFATTFLADLSRGAHLLSRSLSALIGAFPFICLIALFMTSFQPARRRSSMPLSFFLLFLCAATLLSLGTWGLDQLNLKAGDGKTQAPAQAYRGGLISPMDGGGYWAAEAPEKDKPLLMALQADFQSPGPAGILSWHKRMDVPPLPQPPRPAPADALAAFARDGMAVSAMTRPSGGLLPRLWISIALAFFFTSLWIFPRVSGWPLFGAFLSLAAFRAAILAGAAVGSDAFRSLASGVFTGRVIGWLPHAFLVFSGLVLVAWDVLASSARKRAGGIPS